METFLCIILFAPLLYYCKHGLNPVMCTTELDPDRVQWGRTILLYDILYTFLVVEINYFSEGYL